MTKHDFLYYKKISVDINSEKSLKKFFEIFKNLSTNDCAKILKVSPRKIRKLKNKIGIVGNSIDCSTTKSININEIYSLNYNNYYYLYRYRNIGIKKLAKLLKIGVVNLSNLYIKFNIIRDNKIIKHPCRYKEWVDYHYNNLKLSVKDCAYIANVSTNTFNEWIHEFNLNKIFRSKLFEKNKNDIYKICNIINDL